MNNNLATIITSLGILLLTACGTMSGKSVFIPAVPEPGQATIYIYRPSEMTNALYSPGLTINSEFWQYAKNGMNSRISVPPGEYEFGFQQEDKYSELTPLKLMLDAGTITFIRVDTSLKIQNTTGYEPYARSFKLQLVEEKQAAEEIAECCLNNNLQQSDKTVTDIQKDDADDSFSVDKTQNPFSH